MVTIDPYEKWPDSRAPSEEKGTQVEPEHAVEMDENPVDNETRPATKEDVIAAIAAASRGGGWYQLERWGPVLAVIASIGVGAGYISSTFDKQLQQQYTAFDKRLQQQNIAFDKQLQQQYTALNALIDAVQYKV